MLQQGCEERRHRLSQVTIEAFKLSYVIMESWIWREGEK
jgi:hypothetical protein